MRWAITGTPGVGKTASSRKLSIDRPVVHLADILEDERYRAGEDRDRATRVADLEMLKHWLDDQPEDVIVDSHIAHFLPVDAAIVLRCHPDELRRRLTARTGLTPDADRVAENVESEALDLILVEAIDHLGESSVYEIDTSDRSPADVATIIEEAIRGEIAPRVGIVSFLEDHDTG